MTPPLNPPAHKSSYTEPKYTVEEIIQQFTQLTLAEIKASVSIYQNLYMGSQIQIISNQKVPFGLATSVSVDDDKAFEYFVALSPMQRERLNSLDGVTRSMMIKELLDHLVEQRDAFKEAAFTIDSVRVAAISDTELKELRDLGVQILDSDGKELDTDDDDSNDPTRITH